MKRKSLLVAMAAMSLAAIGAGSVSTLAWFVASNNANVSDSTATITGSLSVAQTTKDDVSNEFVINPVTPSNVTGIKLTDAAGKEHVSVHVSGTTYQDIELSASENGIATLDLYANISYAGDITDVTQLNSLWQSKCTTVKLTLSCTNAAGTATKGAAATADVKFVTAADNYTEDATNPGEVSTEASGFAFTTITSGTATTANVKVGTVYIAVRGSNDVVWSGEDASHMPSYTLGLVASHV